MQVVGDQMTALGVTGLGVPSCAGIHIDAFKFVVRPSPTGHVIAWLEPERWEAVASHQAECQG